MALFLQICMLLLLWCKLLFVWLGVAYLQKHSDMEGFIFIWEDY